MRFIFSLGEAKMMERVLLEHSLIRSPASYLNEIECNEIELSGIELDNLSLSLSLAHRKTAQYQYNKCDVIL